MKHSITQTSFLQDGGPPQPLPLQIAIKYNFPLDHKTSASDVMLYRVHDWISGIAKTDQPRRFATEIESRGRKAGVELFAGCEKFEWTSPNGRKYKMDYASDVMLYRVTQYMGRDTGIRNEVLEYLAKAGALVDLLRQDPESAEQAITHHRQTNALASGKTETWITARELGIQARNHCTAAIRKANPDINIGETTNTTYKNVLGQDAAGLRQTLQLGPRQNPRDNMSLIALGYLQVTESSIAMQLEGLSDNDIVPPQTVRNIVAIVSKATGKQAQETAALIGVDLVTGHKLLGGGK